MIVRTLIALATGLAAGAHTATWGMYKDAPHEGFTWPKYLRSYVLSGPIAVVVAILTNIDVTRASGLVILYGVTYAIERAMQEFYKSFLRREDQSKYFIPMQFGVGGKPIAHHGKRLLVGVVYMAAVFLIFAGIGRLQTLDLAWSGLTVAVVVGSAGGWISAFGGAMKDAPHEGFELLKFFRSPVIAAIYGTLLAFLTTSYLLVFLGAIGYTVGTTETYKTFFFPSKPRGKFANKPVTHPEMQERRNAFVPLYVAIWVAVIVAFVIALQEPNEGLL